MLGTRQYLPNLAHPLNQGKVLWVLCLPGIDNPFDLLTGTFSRMPSSARSGALRPGALGAGIHNATSAGGCNLGTNRAFSDLPGQASGFSLACWMQPPAASPISVPLMSKGTGLSAATGWVAQVNGSGVITLALSRSSTANTFSSTQTVAAMSGGSGTPTRVLWSMPSLASASLYVNGIKYANSLTQAGSGTYVSDVAAELHLSANNAFTSGNIGGPMDDFCLWGRAVSAQEAWADFLESATGYAGALLTRPLNRNGATVVAGFGLLKNRRLRPAFKREPVFDYWRKGAP